MPKNYFAELQMLVPNSALCRSSEVWFFFLLDILHLSTLKLIYQQLAHLNHSNEVFQELVTNSTEFHCPKEITISCDLRDFRVHYLL